MLQRNTAEEKRAFNNYMRLLTKKRKTGGNAKVPNNIAISAAVKKNKNKGAHTNSYNMRYNGTVVHTRPYKKQKTAMRNTGARNSRITAINRNFRRLNNSSRHGILNKIRSFL
jgi:hypothetical protein